MRKTVRGPVTIRQTPILSPGSEQRPLDSEPAAYLNMEVLRMWGFSIQEPFSTLLPFPKETDDATSKQSTQKLHATLCSLRNPKSIGP